MKKIFEKETFKFVLILFILLFFISFITICRHFPPELWQMFLEAIGIISKEKSEAESLTKLLKSNYSETSPEYQQGAIYYSEARAEFDSWITKFQSILKTKYKIKKSDPIIESLKESLRRAADKSYKFKEYVKNLAPPIVEKPIVKKPKGLSIPSAIATASAIYNALDMAIGKILRAHQATKEKKRKEMIEILGRQKWKVFDEI